MGSELLGQGDVRCEPGSLLVAHGLRARALDEQGDELAAKCLRHARGGADDAGIGRRWGDADQDALAGVVVAVSQHARGVREAAGAVGAAAQGDLAERGKVLHGEEVLLRPVCLRGAVDESRAKAFEQVLGLDVDELDLVGVIEDAVGDPFAHDDPGDGGDHVVQTLDMLHVHGRVDVDARAQELLDILIALLMTASRRVRMGELVDEDELRGAHDGRIEVEFGERDAVVFDELGGHALDSPREAGGRRALVRLDVARDDVDAAPLGGMGGLQHRVGLAHARGVAEEDLEVSAPASIPVGRSIVLDRLEEEIGVGAGVRCVTRHGLAFLERAACVHPRRGAADVPRGRV